MNGVFNLEIEVVDKTDESLSLLIRGSDVTFVNALRRIILAEVPVMAIDDVVIVENSSMLSDEILAHRMGLIPLKTDLDTYNLPEECQCKSEFGCNLCRVALTLDVDSGESSRTVYSGDFKSENPSIVPVSDKIVIVKLAPNQKVKVEAYARLGKGKVHAKWQPVSMCSYKYLPQISLDEKLCDACGECVKICPKKIFLNVGSKIEVRNVSECTLCQDCVDVCPKNPSAVKVSWDKNSFIFNIESTGALSSERILKEALRILNRKSEDFIHQLEGS